ncbi:hypothetical protein [Azospira restricta]|uniref:Uncharacterized protein n=1 Tax=Azospira restricta TaxID=404405 RepID=A0A974SQQ3_9RHOO|nr:hypothetical protein [Azospira restricta]QRJ64720.1 hypothetical protein IWH25_05055 [Azospira restricta]
MSQASPKRSAAAAPKRRTSRRLRFIAAVRFADGRTQCFSVDNARDHDEARRMVFDEVEDVAAVVISDYR